MGEDDGDRPLATQDGGGAVHHGVEDDEVRGGVDEGFDGGDAAEAFLVEAHAGEDDLGGVGVVAQAGGDGGEGGAVDQWGDAGLLGVLGKELGGGVADAVAASGEGLGDGEGREDVAEGRGAEEQDVLGHGSPQVRAVCTFRTAVLMSSTSASV